MGGLSLWVSASRRSGVVTAVGPEASLFKVGDAVFYAGELSKQGTNAEFHVVDERIVGRKPASVSDAEAAALPLTAITAYEGLFEVRGTARHCAALRGTAWHGELCECRTTPC